MSSRSASRKTRGMTAGPARTPPRWAGPILTLVSGGDQMRLTDEPAEPASGAPPNLREVGRLRVLRALHETERASRPELVRMTGLARATVTALIAELTDLGLVQEYDGPDPLEARRTGRPAHWLSLVPSAGYAVGADIGHQ